jgi:hypothetical protein
VLAIQQSKDPLIRNNYTGSRRHSGNKSSR